MNRCCVKCNSILDQAHVGDIEVDLCPACGGLWLDHGEIERLFSLPSHDLDELRHALTGGAQAGISDAHLACPACPGQLVEARFGRILVEVCRRCRGLFLDRGELDLALAALKSTPGASAEKVLRLAAQSVR